MAKTKDLRKKAQPAEEKSSAEQELDRNEERCGDKDVKDTCLKAYADIQKGFQDQNERANKTLDYWDIYNCELGPNQFYSGNSKVFVPIVHDAIEARRTRFVNQMFPQSGRYVEATTEDGHQPTTMAALLNHYIRKAQLRTQIAPALVRAGDIEGQYTIYVSWRETERHVAWRTKTSSIVEGDGEGDEVEDPDEEIDDIQEEVVTHGCPHVEVLSDADVLVLPQTADNIEDALSRGGSITVLRRWTEAKINQMIEDEEIDEKAGKKLIEKLNNKQGPKDPPDTAKKMIDAAGIKGDGVGAFALVYETWMRLLIDGKKRICRVYYGGEDLILSVKLNPYWSDKVPILSAPLDKIKGSFKGKSKVAPVESFQYAANDAINEGMDSAAFALMPIVMTDPEKNPRVGSMVMSLAAIWETSPNDTQFAKFPELWKDALEIVAAARAQIFQTLAVNPSRITQAAGKKKLNQAEISQEQQIDILTTADAVTVLEEGIFTPMIERFVEMDHQFRKDDLTVRQYGELGVKAGMERIPPVQFHRRWQFKWAGVEAARSAQRVQQQIAALNVVRGIPQQLYAPYKLDLVPVIEMFMMNVFGPEMSPLIFKKPEDQMPVPVDQENLLLAQGFEVPTHEMDDDQQHIQAHMALLQVMEGNQKKVQAHIFEHMQQMQRKQQAMMQAQQGGGPGAPGGPGGAGPGVAGTPRPGAQPMAPRGGQNPAGAIHSDRLQDPSAMPRRAA